MTNKRTVLVVEDDDAIRHGTMLRLSMNGFEVETAVDGKDALPKVAASKPDVVLMDIRMPRMDGLTALRRLKSAAETSDIPVVIASASVEEQSNAIDAGASYFLRKPYSNEALMAAVQQSSSHNENN